MSTRATASFEITGWTEKPYLDNATAPETSEAKSTEPGAAAKLSRVTVTKTFKGDMEGTSTAELLMYQASDGSSGGYLAQEIVNATLGGRAGSFAIQHGGIRTASDQKAFGNIVPGSGTGELLGLRGEVEIRHDDSGAAFVIDYRFEQS